LVFVPPRQWSRFPPSRRAEFARLQRFPSVRFFLSRAMISRIFELIDSFYRHHRPPSVSVELKVPTFPQSCVPPFSMTTFFFGFSLNTNQILPRAPSATEVVTLFQFAPHFLLHLFFSAATSLLNWDRSPRIDR